MLDLVTDFKRIQDCIDMSGISSNFYFIGQGRVHGLLPVPTQHGRRVFLKKKPLRLQVPRAYASVVNLLGSGQAINDVFDAENVSKPASSN
jgi:hypothetical protein